MQFTYFFLLFLQSCTAKEALPVFLIDHDHVRSRYAISSNPFELITKEYFTEIALDSYKKSECLIIFTEETLSREEISIKDGKGTPFNHMQQDLKVGKVMYLPSVKEPYRSLTGLFQPKPMNSYKLSFGTKLQLTTVPKYIYVYFDDPPGLSRAEKLRNHDVLMKEIYSTVKLLKSGPVVAFYTGKSNPVKIEPIEYVSVKHKRAYQSESGVMVVTPDALFRLSGVYAASQTRRSAFDMVPTLEEATRTRRTLSTTMTYHDFELQFNFKFRAKDWQLENVVLLEVGEEVGRTQMLVGAPWNSSFFCAEPLTVVNARDGSSITVSQYQIQPVYRPDLDSGVVLRSDSSSEAGNTTCFGATVNCGPYFNSHILSGLFVASLVLVITMWGIIMLFNCDANSRYDDPHAKTIVIIAEGGS